MWSKTYSKKVKGLKAEQVWKVWTDVNQWHTWQSDIEYARLEGEFRVGNTFLLKPEGGPRVNIEIIIVEPNRQFTDLTRFPGAKMYGSHEFVIHGDELEIKTTMSIEGPLSFVWRKIVAEDVANGMMAQTDSLIEKARNG
ncbi:MAG TPA: SRPBCC domain-containing protein [Gallionella sp.]|nr:SRPBCC domain-containing protein [Gallionella sp.]